MSTDLPKIDPATEMPLAELDALIAGPAWMGWEPVIEFGRIVRWLTDTGNRSVSRGIPSGWHPTTNAAHAGEARRRADDYTLETVWKRKSKSRPFVQGIQASIYLRGYGRFSAQAMPWEVTGSTDDEIKERAEALATCRAILAAIQAIHKQADAEDGS